MTVDRNPNLARAIAALQAFGDDLNRVQVGELLPMWRHYRDLSDNEVAAVLRWFPVPDDDEEPQPGDGGDE